MVGDEPPRLQKGSDLGHLLQHPADHEEALWWSESLRPATRDSLQSTGVLLLLAVICRHPLKLLLALEEVVANLCQGRL